MMKKIMMPWTISLITIAYLLNGCGNSSSANDEENLETKVPTTLSLKWSIDTNQSESAIYDNVNNVIYISNHADGNGYISKVDVNGNMLSEKWFPNLNYPMGMSIANNKLYIVDNTFSRNSSKVVVVDPINSEELIHYDAPNTMTRLNDITYSQEDDNFYISNFAYTDNNENNDSIVQMTSSGIYSEFYNREDQLSESQQNGVLIDETELIIQEQSGYLKSLNITTKELSIIADSIDGIQIDGIAKYKDIGYIVSGALSDNIQNRIYFINKDGTSIELDKGDTTSIHDISYAEELNLLLVPSLSSSYLRAYEIE